jgi:hypothetical protein
VSLVPSIALALALAAEPALPAPPAGASPAARPVRRDRIELRVSFRSWEAAGTFRMETASGRTDQGVVRDQGGFSATGGAVRRVLEGEKGALVLRLQGQTRSGTPSIFGRWTVASGTGVYAGMTGGGTFTAMGSGGRRGGSPYELQFLIGHLVHEW